MPVEANSDQPAFRDVARHHLPRLCVADLVVDEDLPPEVLTSDSAWAG